LVLSPTSSRNGVVGDNTDHGQQFYKFVSRSGRRLVRNVENLSGIPDGDFLDVLVIASYIKAV
jgi:hypothetical protein